METREKEYSELSDNEKKALREYRSWVKSDAPHEYRMNMIESCYKTLQILGVESFVN
jgi:hypothetical protein